MSTTIKSIDRARVQFDDSITSADVDRLLDMPEVRTLQASAPVPLRVWTMLDREFFAQRPDVALRVYGHYGMECDLAFCEHMLHVRHFLADCLSRASNVDAIGSIPHLETLSLGIFELDTLDVLNRVPDSLIDITLGWTRSKKPNIEPLCRFRRLRRLYLEGHTKGIEAISTLVDLEDLTLRSISTQGVEYLQPLEKLWSLDIKLGGIGSLAAIEGKSCIKYLELWQIRGYSDLDIVRNLPGLQNLFVQSMPKVAAIPLLDDAVTLRRIVLQNMGGLKKLDSLRHAPSLEEFLLIEGNKQQPEDLIPVLENRNVSMVGAWFGSTARNDRFDRLRDAHDKRPWEWREFAYR